MKENPLRDRGFAGALLEAFLRTIDAATAEAICCDAGVLTEDGKAHGHHAPPISESLRRRILARDGYRCRACGSRDQLHVHHIVWRSKKRLNAWANCMAACTDCHTLVHGGS